MAVLNTERKMIVTEISSSLSRNMIQRDRKSSPSASLKLDLPEFKCEACTKIIKGRSRKLELRDRKGLQGLIDEERRRSNKTRGRRQTTDHRHLSASNKISKFEAVEIIKAGAQHRRLLIHRE